MAGKKQDPKEVAKKVKAAFTKLLDACAPEDKWVPSEDHGKWRIAVMDGDSLSFIGQSVSHREFIRTCDFVVELLGHLEAGGDEAEE